MKTAEEFIEFLEKEKGLKLFLYQKEIIKMMWQTRDIVVMIK